MWVYQQSSGQLFKSLDGMSLGTPLEQGYSGHAEGKNNPGMQNVHDIGPIPRGMYTIGPPHDTPTHGPHVMALTPDPTNQEFGRGDFLMHGDSVTHDASKGCIIMSRATRDKVSSSRDIRLQVIT